MPASARGKRERDRLSLVRIPQAAPRGPRGFSDQGTPPLFFQCWVGQAGAQRTGFPASPSGNSDSGKSWDPGFQRPRTCLRGGVVNGREACGGHTGAPFSLRDRGPFPWPVSWENPDSHPGFARRSDSCSTSSWGSRGNESPQSTGATSVFGWPWGVSPQNVTLAILTVFRCTVLGH